MKGDIGEEFVKGEYENNFTKRNIEPLFIKEGSGEIFEIPLASPFYKGRKIILLPINER